MNRAFSSVLFASCVAGASILAAPGQEPTSGADRYLTWNAAEAEAIGKSMYERGRVGGFWDTRMLKTDRSYNYKLAATWLTPDVIKAAARLAQLRSRLSDDETRQLVAQALGAGDTVVMVEIDPREGSGVIPLDWEAFLQPAAGLGPAVRGTHTPALRDVKALAVVLRRNYDYDRFWVVFPLVDEKGAPTLPAEVVSVELVVRIYDKEGRVTWRIPPSIRERVEALRRNAPASRDAPGAIHSRGNTLEAMKVRPGRIADRTSSAPVAICATA